MSDVLKYVSNTNVLKQPREKDCGYDLRSAQNITIAPHEQSLVDTDLRIQLPKNTWGNVRDRSSMAMQRIYTRAGVIDEGYTGIVKVLLQNANDFPAHIIKGDKIAQLIVCPYVSLPVMKVDSLDETERGEDGFGSTGQ